MTDEIAFWMTYGKGSLSNHIQYAKREDAEKEAERVAEATGETVYVMYAVSGYKTLDRPVIDFQTVPS